MIIWLLDLLISAAKLVRFFWGGNWMGFEGTTCPLPRTWAHRRPQLVHYAVIDRGERMHLSHPGFLSWTPGCIISGIKHLSTKQHCVKSSRKVYCWLCTTILLWRQVYHRIPARYTYARFPSVEFKRPFSCWRFFQLVISTLRESFETVTLLYDFCAFFVASAVSEKMIQDS